MREQSDDQTPEPTTGSVPYQPSSADDRDPVIEVYKKDVDRTLVRENLKLTVEERFRKFEHVWK
jgi:hypothetical protein